MVGRHINVFFSFCAGRTPRPIKIPNTELLWFITCPRRKSRTSVCSAEAIAGVIRSDNRISHSCLRPHLREHVQRSELPHKTTCHPFQVPDSAEHGIDFHWRIVTQSVVKIEFEHFSHITPRSFRNPPMGVSLPSMSASISLILDLL